MSQSEYLRRWRRRQQLERAVLDSVDSSEDLNYQGNSICNVTNDNMQVPDEICVESPQRTYEVNNKSSSGTDDESVDTEMDFSDFDDLQDDKEFTGQLATWACEYHHSQEAINKLLKLLRENGHPELPKDSRTLKNTPRKVPVMSRCGGDYFYIGIEKNIIQQLDKMNEKTLSDLSLIDLSVNIDGIPLYKSSAAQLWPILGLFSDTEPFIICLYHAAGKPNNNEEYLSDFIIEAVKLKDNGIMYNGKIYSFGIKGFFCDAPARQFIKGVKGHTGYYACERCTVQGEMIEGRMTFHDLNCEQRTERAFNNMEYNGQHQQSYCPFIPTFINCISDFGLDYMHLVCLGVVKRVLLFLKEGPRCCRISPSQQRIISDVLESFRGHLPSEMARQPRSLIELKRWKATEFRQFVLYTGVIALKSILSKDAYLHFLSLVVALRIMLESDRNFRMGHLDYAKDLLRYFVGKSRDVYGPTFAVYNVHSLIHLHEDVMKFDVNLDLVSCFPFENHLQVLKKFVKQSKNPIAQVFKRCTEFKESGGKLPRKMLYTKICNGKKDHCFLLHSGDIACVHCEGIEVNTYICDIINKSHLEEFFSEPCLSSIVNIFSVKFKNLKLKRRTIHRDQFLRKMVYLNVPTGVVLVALLHNVSWDM